MKKSRVGRSKVLSLRLKPKEHEFLVAEAEQMYLPLSAYLRHKLFGPPVTRPKQPRRK